MGRLSTTECTYLPTYLFGLQSRRSYTHYASLWKDECPPRPCSHCHVRHNLSVHGVLAHCSPYHPLVRAWFPPGHSLHWLPDGAAQRSTATCASLDDSLYHAPSISTSCSPWVGHGL